MNIYLATLNVVENGFTDEFEQLCYKQANLFSSARIECDQFMTTLHFGGIPSTPDNSLSSIAFIVLATSSGVNVYCPKYSDIAS